MMLASCDECVFPFVYNRNIYHKCTWDYFRRPSCITNSSSEPQECTNDCPTESKICSECKFPFEYMGKNYSKCTSYNWMVKGYAHNLDVNGILSWCVTNQSEFHTHTGWQYCSNDCPTSMHETDYKRYMKISLGLALISLLVSSLLIAMICRWLCKKCSNGSNFNGYNRCDQSRNPLTRSAEDLGFIQLVEVQTINKTKVQFTRTQRHSKGSYANCNPSVECDEAEVGIDIENSIALHAVPHPNARKEYTTTYHRFEILIDKEIGSGYFGTIYRARKVTSDSLDGTEVVVKTIPSDADSTKKTMLLNEIELLSNLQHHFNIVRMLGACTTNLITKEKLWLVLEYCQRGDLKQYLLQHKNEFCDGYRNSWIKRRLLLIWSYHVAKGMQHLSQHLIRHGDLNARNILIDEYVDDGEIHLIAKLSGFGMSTRVHDNICYQKSARNEASCRWMAIEFLSFGHFTSTSDVWSYGVTFWEILALGEEPYSEWSLDDLIPKITDGYRLECPFNVNGAIEYDFLGLFGRVSGMCFVHDPQERKTFCDVVSMLEVELTQDECDRYKKMSRLA